MQEARTGGKGERVSEKMIPKPYWEGNYQEQEEEEHRHTLERVPFATGL